jgi:PAS domain S-box-containing protein
MTTPPPPKPDFETLFAATPALYVVLLPDPPRFTILAATEAYARATMTRLDEIVGRGIFDVFPDNPADPHATGSINLRASLERVVATRLPDRRAVQQYDVRRPAESGGAFEERWWSARSTPVFGPDGELAYILHAIEDVTERKHLEEQRQLFAALVENSSDFIAIADAGGRPLYINPAGRRMVGLSPEHPVGETQIVDYYPTEERTFATEVIGKTMLESGHWSGETTLRHWKTGETIPVSKERFLIRDVTTGRLLGMGTVTRDISEARRIARQREDLLSQMRESEERFRLTIDEAPIGMALVTLDGRFVRVNRALCEILAYSPAELLALTLSAITHPDDRDADADLALTGQLARGEIPRYQVAKRCLRKDGQTVDIMLSASLLRDHDGAPLYYIAQMEEITERKRAEEALRRSEAQFRGLIERMPDGVFVNSGGRVAYANSALGRLLGYDDATALLGQMIEELYHPDDHRLIAERTRVLQAGGGVPPRELRMVRRDQSLCSVETTAILVQFDDRPGILVIVRDLTERKRAEEALRVSEAKYSGIVAIAADAIISIDDDQRITIFNDGAEKIFGYSRSEAVGAPLDMLIPQPFRADHRRHVAGFAAGGVTARRMGEPMTTIAGRRKNGEEFPAEAAISKLQVGDKTLLTVALRDITDRRRVEREQQLLAEAGVVLGATLDYEQTLATVARLAVRNFADWCVVEVMEEQAQLRRLKVVSADPANAALCDQLEHMPLDRDRPYLIRSVVETRQSLLMERISPEQLKWGAQGAEHLRVLIAIDPVSLMALPLLMRGELLGTLTFISSTPARLYAAADLRMAQALAERAAMAIENARLYRASVQAAQLRDQVLSVVAHDLRNPLSTIRLQAAGLQRTGSEPERRSQRPRELIDRAAARMNRLIQDLLDVARMEAGQLTVERVQLAAAELTREAAEMQRPLAASSSLELRVEVAPDLPELWGDRHRLLQVFENLIGNAIKFTPPGGRITIGARPREHEVLFWVADTGCGIGSDGLTRVFDRFWQAARTDRQGAGLGLPITKGIVEAHGGRIWVESAPGQGSTFFFALASSTG